VNAACRDRAEPHAARRLFARDRVSNLPKLVAVGKNDLGDLVTRRKVIVKSAEADVGASSTFGTEVLSRPSFQITPNNRMPKPFLKLGRRGALETDMMESAALISFRRVFFQARAAGALEHHLIMVCGRRHHLENTVRTLKNWRRIHT